MEQENNQSNQQALETLTEKMAELFVMHIEAMMEKEAKHQKRATKEK